MECVYMKSEGSQFLTLEVPGLAERRPSLVYGDYVFAKLASGDANDITPVYQVCSSFQNSFLPKI